MCGFARCTPVQLTSLDQQYQRFVWAIIVLLVYTLIMTSNWERYSKGNNKFFVVLVPCFIIFLWRSTLNKPTSFTQPRRIWLNRRRNRRTRIEKQKLQKKNNWETKRTPKSGSGSRSLSKQLSFLKQLNNQWNPRRRNDDLREPKMY